MLARGNYCERRIWTNEAARLQFSRDGRGLCMRRLCKAVLLKAGDRFARRAPLRHFPTERTAAIFLGGFYSGKTPNDATVLFEHFRPPAYLGRVSAAF
jgi:hypothetical protein